MNRFLFFARALLFAAALPLVGQAQTTVLGTIRFGGVVRDYRLYVPAAYQPGPGGAAVPLLFNLHGYGSNSLEQENYGDFRPIADTANFLVLHPNGTFATGTTRYWNTFAPPGAGGPDDVGFLSALLDSIRLAYAVDTTRVYATGMSNGGFMSYELACHLSERIAAVASVTGSMARSHLAGCAPQHLTPVMQIHGTADNTVPYGGSAGFLPVPAVVAHWVGVNQAGAGVTTMVPNTSTTDGCTAERTAYSHPTLGEVVVHYRVIGGGHTWPGAAFQIGVTNRDFNASTEVWRFLRRFQLDQLPALVVGVPAAVDGDAPALRVAPNPVGEAGTLRVQLGGEALRPGQVRVFDALGRMVASGLAAGGAEGVTLDARAWPAGMYRVRVVLADGRAYGQTVVR